MLADDIDNDGEDSDVRDILWFKRNICVWGV
jgi:hypothetical protein